VAAPQVIKQLEGFGQVNREDSAKHEPIVMDWRLPLRRLAAPQGVHRATLDSTILPLPAVEDEPAPGAAPAR